MTLNLLYMLKNQAEVSSLVRRWLLSDRWEGVCL